MKRLLIVVTIFFFSACATSPTGRNQLMLVSPQQAISASQNAYVQTLAPLQKSGKLDSDPRVTARVRYITGRVIAQAVRLYPESRSWQWDIRVIDDPETVNAWCMAGGKMAIYTGLLEKVKPTDDELAQVIAHEVAHAVANHSAERMSVAMASQLGLSTLALATSDSENRGLTLAGAALAAKLAVELPYSRAAEVEADRIGIELAARAGYNPYATSSMWQKMAAVGGNSPPQFLSTHPSPRNRMANLQRLSAQMMPYYQQPGSRPVYDF